MQSTPSQIDTEELRKSRLVDGFGIFFETDCDPEDNYSGPRFLSIFVDVEEISRIDSKLAALKVFGLRMAQCAAEMYALCERTKGFRPGKKGSMHICDAAYTLRDDGFCLTAQFGEDSLEERDTNELSMRTLNGALELEGMCDGSVGWLGQDLIVSLTADTFGSFAGYLLSNVSGMNAATVHAEVTSMIQASAQKTPAQ